MTITDSADIRFDCPHCGQPFVVEASGAGLETSCPICESKVVVPQLGAFDHRDYGHGVPEKNRVAGSRGSRPEFSNADAHGLREDLSGENAALRHQIKAASGERAQLKAELAAVKQRLATTESQLAESRARAADLHSGLAMANEELAATFGASDERATVIETLRQQTSHDLDIAREKLRALEAELAIREREREEARGRAASLEQELGHAKGEISALQDESGLYRRNFDEAQAKLAETAQSQLELASTKNELHATDEKLKAAEDGCKSLAICCEELRKEAASLRSDLQGSESGRELLELRARFQQEQEEHRTAARKLAQAGQETHLLAASGVQLRSDLEEARRSHADAERRAEAGSESRLSKDNFVLRGIIERQNDELTQRLHDLNGLRQARLWLRLTYALFAVGFLGVIAFGLYVVPLVFK